MLKDKLQIIINLFPSHILTPKIQHKASWCKGLPSQTVKLMIYLLTPQRYLIIFSFPHSMNELHSYLMKER